MKKTVSALLALATVLSLSGCEKKEPEPTAPLSVPETTVVTEPPYTAPVQVSSETPTVPDYVFSEELRRSEADVIPTEPLPTSTRATVTGDFVLIRSGPTAKSKNLGRKDYGDRVVIYEAVDANGEYWARIKEGWMSMLYLKPDGPLPAADPAEGAPAFIWGANRVNVREEPDVEARRVTRMARNSFVRAHETVKGKKSNWVRINQGWVSEEYILLLKPLTGDLSRLPAGSAPTETQKATAAPETTAETTEAPTVPPETAPAATEATVPSSAATVPEETPTA